MNHQQQQQQPIYEITVFPWGARVSTRYVIPADEPCPVGDYKGKNGPKRAENAVKETGHVYTIENW